MALYKRFHNIEYQNTRSVFLCIVQTASYFYVSNHHNYCFGRIEIVIGY